MLEHHIDSVARFVASVLDHQRARPGVVVFRGQRHDYPLLPRVVRGPDKGVLSVPDCLKREFHTYGMFGIHGVNLIPPHISLGESLSSGWYTLMLMQHHGVPTRLLDWTEDPLVALYFAVGDLPAGHERPVVYAFETPDLYRVSDLARKGYAAPPELFAQRFEGEADRDLILLPPRLDRRIEAQRGLFALTLNPHTPMRPSAAWRIDPGAVASLREDLEALGRDHFALFPDLHGLGRWLAESAWE